MPRSPWIISVLPKRLKPAGARLVKVYATASRRVERFIFKWFPEPKVVPVVPIEDFLHHAHITLLDLQRRQYLLEAVDTEWPRITKGKSYWLHDDSAFRAIVDVDTMNVVDPLLLGARRVALRREPPAPCEEPLPRGTAADTAVGETG